jgi:NAD(P)-dependent dehydrogenase (short-subunit alcohol dehydrogenase family)
VCIVTGAGQGIGRATARRLAQERGKIVIVDQVDKGAAEAVIELRQYGVDRPRRWLM